MRFQADANLDPDICRGLCRLEPRIDFESHVGVTADGMTDPDVLELAAENGRVLVKTMLTHFTNFVSDHESPGVILIRSSRTQSSIIGGLLMVWLSWTPERVQNQALWLPRVD